MSSMNTEMKSFIAISDIISLLNMSSGFLSIISSINHNFELAAILMIIAIIFDSSDGWVARKTNRQDDLGFGKNIIDTKDFIGFPIPGISLVLATYYLSGLFNPYVALILSAIISLLMICNIRYPKFDNIPVIAISAILIVILILPINIIIYNINVPALILLLFCLYYLIINLIKR